MANEQATIPPELENLLLEFTINAIEENPEDLVSHAADYFTRLRDKKQSKTEDIHKEPVSVDKESASKEEEPERKVDEESRQSIAQNLGSSGRRGTVVGESYNPEDEKDDDDDVEVYPKTDEQRKRIKDATAGIFLFRVLDEEDLTAVIDAMMPKEITEGDVVIQQGDDGDFFYLIDEGKYDIFIKNEDGEEKYIGEYDNGGFFGELALLHNQPRAATIKASTDGLLWAVGRKTFNKLIVKRAFEKRHMYMNLLNEVPQLKPLTEYERMQVADALVARSYKEGDVIVTEGDEGDGMYFIVEGRVSVIQKKTADDETTEEEISQLNKGAFFGELALVKHQPRAATIVAMEATKAAFLDVKAFERLLGPCMEIMERHAETYK